MTALINSVLTVAKKTGIVSEQTSNEIEETDSRRPSAVTVAIVQLVRKHSLRALLHDTNGIHIVAKKR